MLLDPPQPEVVGGCLAIVSVWNNSKVRVTDSCHFAGGLGALVFLKDAQPGPIQCARCKLSH
jgi:hypothetical protein